MSSAVIIVSNNYSPGFPSSKWPQLLEQLRDFASRPPFAGARVSVVRGSRWADVCAALPRGGRGVGAGRALWVSSGSDRDPDAAGARAVQTTANNMSALGWPSLLICWSFECYLWPCRHKGAQEVVRQVSFRQPANTYHSWRGARVTASHRFAAPDSPALRARLAELRASGEEYYTRAQHRVLASLEVGAYVVAVQFHPECGPAELMRGLLLELTATWRYRGLLVEFGLQGGDRAPHLPWQPAGGSRGPLLRFEVFTRPEQSSTATPPAQVEAVLSCAREFVRKLALAEWPAGCGPAALVPWSGRRVRLFLASDPAGRRLPWRRLGRLTLS